MLSKLSGMSGHHTTKMSDRQRLWFTLGAIVLFLVLLHSLQPILLPFIFGAILAYLLTPCVKWLQSRKVPHLVSVLIICGIFVLFIVFILLWLTPIVSTQLDVVIAGIPNALHKVQELLRPWLLKFGLQPDILAFDAIKTTLIKHWKEASDLSGGWVVSGLKNMLTYVGESSINILLSAGNILLIPVVAFYLLRDWNTLLQRLIMLVPQPLQPKFIDITKECDSVLKATLRGQLMVMFCLAIIYSIGLSVVGLNIAILVGLLSGLLSIIPYLGFIVGITVASIAAYLQFDHLIYVVYVWIAFGIGQMFESALLIPVLVGDKLGMHPVVVIFIVLAGGELAGFTGILLALPLSAILIVLLKHLYNAYRLSLFYSSDSDHEAAALASHENTHETIHDKTHETTAT